MQGPMRIYYDDEGDYLTLFIGDSKPNYGEDIGEDITIFKDQETGGVIGIGILNFKTKTKSFNNIKLDLPFEVNFSELKV